MDRMGASSIPLVDEFRATTAAAGLGKASMIWENQAEHQLGGHTVTVPRTQDLPLHSSPQWEKKDLKKLVEGSERVFTRDSYDPEYGFHVSTYGSPNVRGRSDLCPHCAASEHGDDPT